MDQLSSCGEGTKQWDFRYILKAKLKGGESEVRTHRFWSECLFLSWLKPWEDHISGDNNPESCCDSLMVRFLVGIQVELVSRLLAIEVWSSEDRFLPKVRLRQNPNLDEFKAIDWVVPTSVCAAGEERGSNTSVASATVPVERRKNLL